MEILEKLAKAVEFGKINQNVPASVMKGEPGADELVQQAIAEGMEASVILSQGLIAGMERVGVKFKANVVYVPQVLMSAKAMSTAMKHLKSRFGNGGMQRKGTFVIGTVDGDLHDIGKNLVAMMVEGNGYEVIDLGVDVKPEKFVAAMKEHPGAFMGMSALLTTTMTHMEKINEMLKAENPGVKTFVGGAPVTAEFARQIGADYYTDGPQELVEILNKLTA
ncbi:MAG: corrinoid protein [Bacteroides sp.]|nr:corrinoid protein [Bacteroides sp.]MCM1447986.1 corrinoid protein [Bacteroides sp.]MCM1515434.1 corrinoid protein [Paraprevotella sp.]